MSTLYHNSNITKFVESIKLLPQKESCQVEVYKDSSINVKVKVFKEESKTDLFLIIKNPEVLLGENEIGFPKTIAEFSKNDTVKNIIRKLFKEIDEKDSLGKRSNFEFMDYSVEDNKVIYRTIVEND